MRFETRDGGSFEGPPFHFLQLKLEATQPTRIRSLLQTQASRPHPCTPHTESDNKGGVARDRLNENVAGSGGINAASRGQTIRDSQAFSGSDNLSPRSESPQTPRLGSFTQGTLLLNALTHLAFHLSPTVFAGRLPQPTRLPIARSRGFRSASGTTRPSDDSPCITDHFALAYRAAYFGATRRHDESSRGHASIFRTVPPANTSVRWVDKNAFGAIVPPRPCPTFGRPVRRRGSPHRLRPGTSPHALRIPPRGGHPALRSLPRGGSRSALAVSGFRLRARLGISIPSSHSGRRGITPAFGYGAPHPSAGGTSTLLIDALPGAHYGSVRLPTSVRHRRASLDFPMRSAAPLDADGRGISRFSCRLVPCMRRVSDRAGSQRASRWRRTECGLPSTSRTSAPRSTHRLRSGTWITRLNTWPARIPVNASSRPSRAAAHDSGPVRVATPSPYDSFIHSNQPV